MPTKPTTAAGYGASTASSARQACLYVATCLGDLTDHLVVVGGLVPSLIVAQREAAEAHVGTRDLDLGLALAMLAEERYKEVAERLRGRGFVPGTTADGKTTRQTWRLRDSDLTVDFLIAPRAPPTDPPQRGGKLQSLEHDFAAIVTPGSTTPAAPTPSPPFRPSCVA